MGGEDARLKRQPERVTHTIGNNKIFHLWTYPNNDLLTIVFVPLCQSSLPDLVVVVVAVAVA